MNRAHVTTADPLMIRRVLAHSDSHTQRAAADEFRVATSTVTTWRRRRAEAAARGEQWPSDDDVDRWHTARADRAYRRLAVTRWRLRNAVEGKLLIDPTGTQRRIHALAVLGWRYIDIAAEAGVSQARIGHLATGLNDTIHRDTAAAIAAVYDRLSMTLGPSSRQRTWARNRGWPPPLAWDDDTIDDPKAQSNRGSTVSRQGAVFDEIAVQRAMHGDRVQLRPVERAEAVYRLTAAGHPADEIGRRLGIEGRSVQRIRDAHRAQGEAS